jgi:MSHA biogenesis protein MshO
MRGATLIELVTVLSLLAIISVAAAVMLADPIRAYQDTRARAELSDIADLALRRMGREIRLALPNSLRVATSGSASYLELLVTRTGGRYRASTDASSAGDILDFSASDGSFDTVGPLSAAPGQAIQANDELVVYNLFSDPSVQYSNAYGAENASVISNPPTAASDIPGDGIKINFNSLQFPVPSPGNRFQVVSGPLSFVCAPGALDASGNGTGTLDRVSSYTKTLSPQPGPTGFPGSPVTARLANFVSACDIRYETNAQNIGVVGIRLELTRRNEAVVLYYEVHVINVP